SPDIGRQSFPTHIKGEGGSQSDAEPFWRFLRGIVVGEIVLRKTAERRPRDADTMGRWIPTDRTVSGRHEPVPERRLAQAVREQLPHALEGLHGLYDRFARPPIHDVGVHHDAA